MSTTPVNVRLVRAALAACPTGDVTSVLMAAREALRVVDRRDHARLVASLAVDAAIFAARLPTQEREKLLSEFSMTPQEAWNAMLDSEGFAEKLAKFTAARAEVTGDQVNV